MKFAELEPAFYRHREEDGRELHVPVDKLEDAQGVMFLCPKCFVENKGGVGTHHMMCWFSKRGVPNHVTPKPGRWDVSGTGLEDLTLSPSVLIIGGCGWHGFITNGEVTSV